MLLEVVVATFILSLAIVPILMGLTAALLSADRSVAATVATNLLRDRAEKLKAAGWAVVPVGRFVLDAEYADTAFVVVQQTTQLPNMTTNPDGFGTSLVKKIVLSAYRRPYVDGDPDNQAVAKWEFLLYAEGI